MKRLTAYLIEKEDEEKFKELLKKRDYSIFPRGEVFNNQTDRIVAVLSNRYNNSWTFGRTIVISLERDSKLKKILEDFKA